MMIWKWMDQRRCRWKIKRLVIRYDLQAADCDGSALAEQYDIDLSTGQTWTLGR